MNAESAVGRVYDRILNNEVNRNFIALTRCNNHNKYR
jgi:hypothetical protein